MFSRPHHAAHHAAIMVHHHHRPPLDMHDEVDMLEGYESLQLTSTTINNPIPCYPYHEKATTHLPPPSRPQLIRTPFHIDDKNTLQALNDADDAAQEAARAKAALKEAKKQARKDLKKEAKRTARIEQPPPPHRANSPSCRGASPTQAHPPPAAATTTTVTVTAAPTATTNPAFPHSIAAGPSTESLTLTPIPLTPALSAASSVPSLPYPLSPPLVLPQLPEKHSFTVVDDPVAAAKAAVKAAKRKAQAEARQANRAVARLSDLPHRTPSLRRSIPQPWELALDQLQYAPTPFKAARSTPASVATFKVPVDRQLLVDFDTAIPLCDFDTSHNVASAIVEELVEKYGRWSITFSDPSYRIFISTDKGAAISFKVCEGLTSRVAVVFGDPLCDPLMMEEVITQFRTYCRARRWRTAFVGVTEAVANVSDIKRWTSVQFAVEQVVDPMNNVILDGTKGKRMSVAIKKLVKDNVLRIYDPAQGVDHLLQAYLQGVYDQCYSAKEADKGDTTAYSTKLSLFELPRVMTYFYTVGADGLPNGVAGVMNVSPGKYLLDPVVSLPAAPRDTSDFLTVAVMGFLRRKGVRHMSFGLEPLREIGELRGLNTMWHADTRMINAASFDALGFSGKKILHDKFYPDPAAEEKLFLILGSRNCITQLDAAMAITNATHLKASPVVRRLIWMTQAKNTGTVIEAMISKLVRKGQLPKHAAESGLSPVSSPNSMLSSSDEHDAASSHRA